MKSIRLQSDENELKAKAYKMNEMKTNWKWNRNEAKQDENKNEMNYQIYGTHRL